jgi:hypothetical protein
MVVRRWAPDTLLNGHGFADAELVPGDRLRIGPVELEVLGLDSLPSVSVPAPFNPSTRQQLPSAERPLEHSLPAPEQERPPLADRSGGVDQESGVRDANGLAVASPSSATAAEEQIRLRLVELEAQGRALLEERELWDVQRRQTEQQLSEMVAGLEAQRAELDGKRLAFEAERQHWESIHAEGEQALARQTEDLNSLRADLESQRAALDDKGRVAAEECRQWESQCRRIEQQHQDELESLRTELAETRRLLESRPVSEPVGHAEEDRDGTIQAEEPSGAASAEPTRNGTNAPVSLTDVFQSLGIRPLADSEPEPAEPSVLDRPSLPPTDRHQSAATLPQYHEERGATASTPPVRAATQPRSGARSATSAHESGDDEESIQDYMAKLLERAGVSPDDMARAEQAQPSRPRPTVPEEPRPVPAPVAPASPPQHKPLKQLAPRTMAPERTVSFSAMRELANSQAQSAISQYARTKAFHTVASKLFVAITAGITGVLLVILWRKTGDDITLCSAAAAFLVAALWGIQHAMLSGWAIMRVSRRRMPNRMKPVEAPEAVDLPSHLDAEPSEPSRNIADEDWQGLLGGMGPPQKDEG